MSASTQNKMLKEHIRARDIQRIALLITVLATLNSIVQLRVFFLSQAWQPLVVFVLAISVALGNFFLVRELARAGRLRLAATLLLSILSAIFLLLNLFLAGMSIPFAIGSAFILPFMGYMILPRRQIKWAATAGIALTLLILAVNYFEPVPRFDGSGISGGPTVIVPLLLVGFVLVVVWQAARLFMAGSLRTKLIVSFLAVSLVPIVAMGFFNYRTTGETGNILALGIGLGVLAVIGAIVLAHIIAGPLRRLTDLTNAIAEGNLDVKAPIETQDEINVLAQSFNTMTARLRELIGSLEGQVATHTAQLATVLEVNQSLTAILDVDELMAEVVELIKSTFGYYHAHIYLLDETGDILEMREGTGEAGRQMKARGHSIPLATERSLVARAARTKMPVLVTDVQQEPDWLPNALLPETKSEMAMPIILNGTAVGVLDVQQNRVDGLTEDDVQILNSLANQVAIAARNAQLYQISQKALQEAEAVQKQYLQAAWDTFLTTRTETFFEAGRTAPILENQPDTVRVPLSVRGQKVGMLGIVPPSSGATWSDDEIALVEAVSRQVSSTVENLRLFEETQQRAAREQLTRQITDKIRASRDIETAMKTAAEELSKALRTTGATVNLKVETKELQKNDNQS